MYNYKKYLKSEDWTAKRQLKNKRRKHCGICGAKKVEIHHLNYKNLYDVEQKDLRRLCHRCHFLVHKLLKERKIIFRNNNHLSQWAILKAAVKKELGVSNVNMFINPALSKIRE